jgi:hypothetical protein
MASWPQGLPNMTSLEDFILAVYGRQIINHPVDSDYTVGTTAVALGSGRGQRTAYIISNTGTVNVAISFNPAVTITTGILLLQGGTMALDAYYDQQVVYRVPWAIGASAGATLHMIETILVGG